MADYIDRKAAIKAIHEEFDECLVWDESGRQTADEVESILTSLPSAEAVEIVRCRDCKHNPNDTWFECPIAHLPYNEDRWCCKGERKDG